MENRFTLQKTTPLKFILLDDLTKTFEIIEYNFSFTMYTGVNNMDDESVLFAQKQQNVSFAKALTFLEGVLNKSVIYVMKDNKLDVDKIFKSIENNFIALPDTSEQTLCAMLHCKLNTITGADTVIETVKLEDINENMMYEYSHDNKEAYMELPAINEWVTDKSYWEVPWWFRNDISTADKIAETEEEYKEWQEKFDEVEKLNTETFREIEIEILEAWQKVSKSEPGELIKVDFNKKKPEKNV